MRSLLLSVSIAAIATLPANSKIVKLDRLEKILSAKLANSVTLQNQQTTYRQDITNGHNNLLDPAQAVIRPNLSCFPSLHCLKPISNTNIQNIWLQEISNLISPQWSLANLPDSQLPIVNKPSLILEQPVSSQPQNFPQLDRSSLIVPPLNRNRLKLIHPAPQTKRIASPFGWRNRPYSGKRQFHQGIDYGAPLGSPVVAATDGIVVRVVSDCNDFGDRLCGGSFGNWIEVDCGNGKIVTYGHLLKNSIKVKVGMTIRQNQTIAKVGSSGWSTGAHLDFRIKINGKYQNPADYIQG